MDNHAWLKACRISIQLPVPRLMSSAPRGGSKVSACSLPVLR